MKTLLLLILLNICYSKTAIYYADKYATKYNVDKRIILSLINTESGGKSTAESHKNCYGLMQVSLIAYEQFYNNLYKTKPKSSTYFLTVPDKMKRFYLMDIERNVRIGTYYYSYCLKRAKGNNILALNYYIMGFNKNKVAFEYIDKIIKDCLRY